MSVIPLRAAAALTSVAPLLFTGCQPSVGVSTVSFDKTATAVARGGYATAIASTPPVGTNVASSADADSRSSVHITVKDSAFDKTQVSADSGRTTITLRNEDAGVTHNIALYKSKNDRTSPLGSTSVSQGPDVQSMTLQLDNGEYYFECQIHPTRLNGSLKVG